MTCGVYEIVNKETNQSYIGRSINIETRWKGHLSSPSNNMIPTVELYEKNPSMVELNILMEINTSDFDKEELKFITSVCELYWINKKGGWESKELINGRDGDILACPPTILSKRELLPKCIDAEDLLYGIEKWCADDYKYKGNQDGDCIEFWIAKSQYYERECNILKNENKELKTTIETDENIYQQKMEVDYKYFKLEKTNNILNDSVEELKETSNFWKTKCLKWRAKYHELLEKRCRNR